MKEKENRRILSAEESKRLGDLIWTHRNIIRITILKILGSQFQYLLEDCESEVALIAVRRGAELLSHPNPTGWFVVAAKYVANNAYRKEMKRVSNLSSDTEIQIKVQDDPLESVLFDDWVKNGIPEALLSRLAPREREIYDMIFVQDMTTAEIAQKLSLSESTVRNIKKNVMDKIKHDIRTYNF